MNNTSLLDTTDLQTRAAALGIDLNILQLEQFTRYAALLREWNERLNLTAVPFEEYVERHFLDCLSMVQSPEWSPTAILVDVGTGAGFPGLPLKIAFPELQLTLIESLQKRCNFLTAVVQDLQLRQVEIISERGEICAHSPQLREQFDIVTARAVANLSMLSEILLPYVRIGGSMIALKGTDIEAEASEAAETIHLSGGDPAQLKSVTLPASDRSLTVVTIKKGSVSPGRLPRSYAAICKKPLKLSR